ncbi:MAG: T9SS type A sorting domain-containing protein [Bacteroidales bacterium]|nr:T9SS type A sorting domain-containing protein [Bacteroidales bacterium]
MQTLITRLLRMAPLLALVLSFVQTNAQRPFGPLAETDFQITMQNIVQPPGTTNVIEFDIYILDTDPSQDLPMATAQFGIYFNLQILNGAAITNGMTIALPYSEGFSDLPSSMAPNGASTLATGLIRIAGRAAPGCPDGFTISKVGSGTRANRFRFTSPVSFLIGSTPNFVFTSNTATNPSYATRFAWYNPACTNIQLPIVPGVNALVLENPVLNFMPLCGDPILYNVSGGGSYCAGGPGVSINLSGSQVGVNYTLNPGGLVLPGTGDPIVFENIVEPAVYTITALSDGTNPAICTYPVNMLGDAVVIATPPEFSEVSMIADPPGPICPNTVVTFTANPVNAGVNPLYEWFVNNISQNTPSSDNTFSTYMPDGDQVFVVMTPDISCSAGTAQSMIYTFEVDPAHPVSVSIEADQNDVCAGTPVTFTATPVNGGSEPQYTWYVNGTGAAGISYLTYVPADGDEVYVQLLADVTQTCITGNPASSDYITMNVDQPVNVELPLIGPFCQGDVVPDLPVVSLNGITGTWNPPAISNMESGCYEFIPDEGQCADATVLCVTINPATTVEFTESACDTYTWTLNGTTYTTTGDYTYIVGCVTNILHLTITPGSIVESYDTALDNFTWYINDETYFVSGIYTHVEECVTYILHLTIINIVTDPEYSTWNGSQSEIWFDELNWTPVADPVEITNVTIPGGCPNYPILTALPVPYYTTINSLTILEGGSLIGQENLNVLSHTVVERTIQNSNFHLISSPVDDVTFGDVFLPAYWMEVWAREYDEPSGEWMNRFIADNLNVGQGYSVQMTTAPQTATFTGMLNGYDVTCTLSNMNTSSDVNRVGWNLLGNPFPSAIDWDMFSTGDYDAQVAVWDQAGAGNYIYWNGTVGSLTNGIIPAQNGFFVKTTTNGASLTIPMAAQVHSPMALYKDAVANALELRANGNNYYDATFVHFNSNATADFDNQYDAFKLEGLETAPQLYNMAAGHNLSINELPFEGNEVVNLGFKCGVAGTYSLNASGLESFNSSTPILLEDLKLNILQDLRLNPVYSFNYATNDSEARFKLHFKAATGIADPANSGIFVYSYEHTVVINNTTNLNGEIRIFDMTGRELKDANMSATSETRLPLQVAVGTYIVKVTTAQGTVNQKVYVK